MSMAMTSSRLGIGGFRLLVGCELIISYNSSGGWKAVRPAGDRRILSGQRGEFRCIFSAGRLEKPVPG
jgi:hypothetical protein